MIIQTGLRPLCFQNEAGALYDQGRRKHNDNSGSSGTGALVFGGAWQTMASLPGTAKCSQETSTCTHFPEEAEECLSKADSGQDLRLLI